MKSNDSPIPVLFFLLNQPLLVCLLFVICALCYQKENVQFISSLFFLFYQVVYFTTVYIQIMNEQSNCRIKHDIRWYGDQKRCQKIIICKLVDKYEH